MTTMLTCWCCLVDFEKDSDYDAQNDWHNAITEYKEPFCAYCAEGTGDVDEPEEEPIN